ncbi:hypothetical protein LUZ61_017174 [Rhynchospora tenuis]|uniref:F-box domain-containing protein n=1 Tax=Rhynchospora tenuis TaxID=198213 RepID=A0AAD5Z6Y2_9POAL|nr:hypothetical protein LUZ61_017174 [Rhynchospora tenuis]
MKPHRKEIPSKQPSIIPSFSQQPWLLQLHGTKEHTLSFINPLNGSIEELSVAGMQGKICLGIFGEWILLLHRKSKGMSLLSHNSRNEIELPAMQEPLESLGSFALSSSPTSAKCIIITVGKGRDFILYSRPKDQMWTKIRPISRSLYTGFITLCQGKVYAPLRWGFVVVIDLESLPTGVIYGTIIKKPCFWGENCHLVISTEKVFSVSVEITLGLVTDAEIYTLDTSRSRSIRRRITTTSPALITEAEGITDGLSVSWADIPVDIVQELLSFLPLPDRIRLVSVCKAWIPFTKSIQDSEDFPWLMCSSDCGSLKFFDTFHGVENSLQMEWLGSDGKLALHFSKDGWVIASDRKNSLFLFNPLTRQGIQLPSTLSDHWLLYMPFSFSSVPTNSDCIVLAVWNTFDSCTLITWHRGRVTWKSQHVEFQDDLFRVASTCPVFYNDEFYILGRKGDLLIFNPITKECRFLNITVPVHFWGVPGIRKDCYLLEFRGELIYVLQESMTASYVVYKLDQSKMVWAELDDLGDMTTFLSSKNCMSRQSRDRLYANGLLFPRFHGDDGNRPVLYSMQSHAFEPKPKDMKEIMNCLWFEPNLRIRKSKKFRKMFSFK